jgi:hypothetical protein
MSDFGTGTFGAATFGDVAELHVSQPLFLQDRTRRQDRIRGRRIQPQIRMGTLASEGVAGVVSRSVAISGSGTIVSSGTSTTPGPTVYQRSVTISGTGTIDAQPEGGIVVALRARLPLDLFAEVTTHDGTRYRWDANQAPGSRLRNFSFRTKIGEGFADANGQLARRIDLDYPDLGLINTVTLTGADGSVAYEGRLAAMPRDLSDTHSIGVTLTGWMAHAKDKKFSEIYRDATLGRWGNASRARIAGTLALTPAYVHSDWSTSATVDPSATVPSILQQTGRMVASASQRSVAESWYDAGPELAIGSLYYELFTTIGTDASWTTQATLSTDDIGTSTDAGTNHNGAVGPTAATLTATTATKRYALLQSFYGGTFTGDGEWAAFWRSPAVYGTHGLTKRGTEPNAGFYASDVMRDIVSRWCPQLDTSGIEDTSYVIGQLAFHDRTFPFDAFLELNKYHLWHLGVWENKRLDFRPYDLTDYDWEIRTDDPGTTFSPQGPSTDTLFNGITVQYQDILTGTTNVLTPDTNPELADTSSTNPWNQHGVDHWDEITLTTPDTEAGAAYLGVAALADRNTPKTPGTITVRGYIRDRAGNDQPAWKPRAGDTISITNFPNDSPRLIVETDYNDEDKSLRIAVDRPFALLEAYVDRVNNALGARGLA